MSDQQTQFQGWAAHTNEAVNGELKFQSFTPKAWDEDDVDVQVMYCGMCGTDSSALAGEWGPVEQKAPLICGHEVIGKVTKVGSEVKGLKVGTIVGIGYQSDSCGACEFCDQGEENFCAKQTATFGAKYHRGHAGHAESASYGGFSKYWRGPARFAIPIPESLDPAGAAPMLCGGVTVFSPLDHYGAGTKAKRVGVIGVGGLGHFAILFASQMGAEVTAISRSDTKKEDATKLGATKYIAAGEDVAEGIKGHERSLDLIICTINPEHLPVSDYMKLLRPRGTFVIVGIVPTPLQISSLGLIGGNVQVAGSYVGSPADIRKMLSFAAEHKISPWIQKYNMDNINTALPDFKAGKPRYRFVLVNTDNGGKM